MTKNQIPRRRETRPFWIGLLLVSALPGCRRAPAADGVAFVHVTVVDVERGQLRPDQTVAVRDHRIATVGPSAQVAAPTGVPVVDGTGKYLIPGLWDMHMHLFDMGAPGAPAVTFPLLIANGVTGVREVGGFLDLELAWRDEITSGRVIGPRMVIAGQLLDGVPTAYLPVSTVVRTPDQGRRAVRSLRDRGAEFIKTYEMLRADVYWAIIDQAKRYGLPVVGHVPLSVDAGAASDSGVRSFEHGRNIEVACARNADSLRAARIRLLENGTARQGYELRAEIHWSQRPVALANYDSERCRALLARLARNGTFQTPTLIESSREARRIDTMTQVRQNLRFIPAANRAEWERWSKMVDRYTPEQVAARVAHAAWLFKLARLMRDAGIPLLAGTDVSVPYMVPGFSLHDELALLVEAGLSPAEALRTATWNPARYFDATDRQGAIRPGYEASLVLLDGDPLADIANTRRIRAVVADGRYLDRPALDHLLAMAEQAARAPEADKPKRPNRPADSTGRAEP